MSSLAKQRQALPGPARRVVVVETEGPAACAVAGTTYDKTPASRPPPEALLRAARSVAVALRRAAKRTAHVEPTNRVLPMHPAQAAAAPAPFFRGCVVFLLGDGPALRGAYAKALADVIVRHGGESVTLVRKGDASAVAARATHVLSCADAAEAAAAALAAAFPPALCVRNLPPLLSPRWVYESAASRQLLPWQVRCGVMLARASARVRWRLR